MCILLYVCIYVVHIVRVFYTMWLFELTMSIEKRQVLSGLCPYAFPISLFVNKILFKLKKIHSKT